MGKKSKTGGKTPACPRLCKKKTLLSNHISPALFILNPHITTILVEIILYLYYIKYDFEK